jgi:hypothetical protein
LSGERLRGKRLRGERLRGERFRDLLALRDMSIINILRVRWLRGLSIRHMLRGMLWNKFKLWLRGIEVAS